MRTRFHAPFHFSVTTDALADFQLLSLPPPTFSSPDPSFNVEIPFLHPDSSIQHQIDKLPFEKALADFISDVIPHLVGAGETCSSEIDHEEELRSAGSNMEHVTGADGSFCEEIEIGRALDFQYGASVSKLSQALFQFEIAEMEEFPMWKVGATSEGIESTLFFEIPDVSVPADYIHVETGVSIASRYEVDRLRCLIEDVSDILIVTQDSFTANDDHSLQDKFYHATKSLSFEVRESGLGFHESLSMDETFNDILAYLKPQNNGDELVNGVKDFLGSTDLIVTEHSSEYDLEHIPLSLNSLLELNPINLSGSILLEKQSVMYPVISDGSSSHFPCSAKLEEVWIFDKVSVDVPDIFSNFETVKEDAFFEQMCKEEIGYMANFNELILTSELSLMDDTFILLPTPFLSDAKILKPESMIVEDIFNALKPHSFSVCDELYLDWHPLIEGVCDNETCSTYISITQEVIGYRIDTSELNSQLDFDFLNDSSGEVSKLQCKEELTNVHGSCPNILVPTIDLDATEIDSHEIKESNDAKQMPKKNPVKVSSLHESNDLSFFLGVRKGNAVVSDYGISRANRPSNQSTSGDTLQEPYEPANLYEPDNEKIEILKATLPGYTLGLIDQIQGIYFSNLNKCRHLISNSSLPTIKDCELLSIPKVRLLELIAEKGGSHYTLGRTDEAFVALLAIFAVKQVVYYLCFFGFQIAYFYVSICSSKVDNLAARLQPLQSLLQVAHLKVEKQIIESHPSLPIIEGLLRSNASEGYQKTLIISDGLFSPSLKHKLTVLRISFHEITHPYCPTEQLDIRDSNRYPISISDALSAADCVLLTYENISATFPFNMFINIVEYGGPSVTSRISDILPCSVGFPRVYFIRLDIEDHHFAKALCEGFDASKNHMISTKVFPEYMKHLLGCLNDGSTEGILCQFPLDKSCFNAYESIETVEASHDFESVKNKPHLSSSDKATAKAFSVPEVVIIVNTQNLEKNMIMSRRSSYQKILALEKRGVQVVERDINLPLDLILSAAVCLVWYEARNIVDKTETVVDISAVPAFIEDIATKSLMSLCLSFSCCIMIFEGESKFLASIMESSDMLYAAAASLDFNLQLFCSYMPETTDEIILNCIRTTGIIDRGLYPAMSESESIAESFLTRFPPLNPLSAHAILSSGSMLVEFLEWPHERRIQAFGKYKVPAESISLFNALCRYGELGESKSVMTDCSSIDSDNSGGILQPKSKRQRYGASSHGPGMLIDESFYSEPSQLNHKSSGTLQPSYSNKPMFHDAPEKTQLFSNAETIYRKHDVNHFNRDNPIRDTWARYSHPNERFSNDVIDYNCSFLDEACTSVPRRGFNLRSSELGCEPDAERFLSSSRLADGQASTFPSASEINWAENALTNSSMRSEESRGRKRVLFDEQLFAKRNHFVQQKHVNAHGQLKHANTVPSIGQFLRANAREPSQQEGPPKQISKSLGEENERRRAHQQSSCYTNPSFPGSLKRKATYQKKSPSIIDSFRYQGGAKQATGTVKKRNYLIGGRPSPRVLDKKDSPLIKPTWTPVDKRARQLLSFTRTGNAQQSKLVWRRSESPRYGCLRKRQRDGF